jgi:hypothetical protein
MALHAKAKAETLEQFPSLTASRLDGMVKERGYRDIHQSSNVMLTATQHG